MEKANKVAHIGLKKRKKKKEVTISPYPKEIIWKSFKKKKGEKVRREEKIFKKESEKEKYGIEKMRFEEIKKNI